MDDLADACIFLLKKYNEPEVINIGLGQETSISQLAQKIKKISGYGGELVYDTSRSDGNPRRLLNTSKMSALGWAARTSLDAGLQLTWNWYLKKANK